MMKTKLISIALFSLLASTPMSAQELKHFTLEDLNFGGTNFRDMQP